MSSRKSPDNAQRSQADHRKARLAEQLRANLQRRKAQVRSRRAGDADERNEGLPGATGEYETRDD